jgi:YegS/Rv2252/BmrU family lipid kinase
MAVIPGGRGNDFARVLGIPTAPREAARLAVSGHEKMLDIATCDGKPFVCIASCGFDSDANRIANEARWVRGNLVYLYAALRAMAAWKPARFELTLDGKTHSFSGYSVAASNSRAYGGGMVIAPDARIDDGQLDVVCTAHMSKLRALANLPKVFKGTHMQIPEVTMRRAAEVRIEADRPFAVYADGDHLADLPATVRLLPRALRVIAPAGH